MLLDTSPGPGTELSDAGTGEDGGIETDRGAVEIAGLEPAENGTVPDGPDGADVADGAPDETVADIYNGEADAAPRANAPEFTDEERRRHLRMGEALLFASAEPLRTEQIADRLPDGADVERVLADLAEHYADRGVILVRVAGGWAFRTATDLSFLMERERVEQRKLSRAALETLAIIAYHQPVTRAEIEDVRGVSVSKGTLDVLMEIGWVRVRGRRHTPGRPVTYGTTDSFLEHFGLDRIGDLPGLDELKAAGVLDTSMPTNISIPRPSDEDDPVAEDDEEDSDASGERDPEDTADAAGAEGVEIDAEAASGDSGEDPNTDSSAVEEGVENRPGREPGAAGDVGVETAEEDGDDAVTNSPDPTGSDTGSGRPDAAGEVHSDR